MRKLLTALIMVWVILEASGQTELKGLNANDDGLYRLTDFEQRFTERIEANDATPSSIRSTEHSENRNSATIYNLQGQRFDKEAQNASIYIKNGRKVMLK